MKATKRAKLQAAGWAVGDAADFLDLSPAEAAYVELKLSLSQALRRWRSTRKLTQTELAKRLGSSQSRVAKMEAGDPTVSKMDRVSHETITAAFTCKAAAACGGSWSSTCAPAGLCARPGALPNGEDASPA